MRQDSKLSDILSVLFIANLVLISGFVVYKAHFETEDPTLIIINQIGYFPWDQGKMTYIKSADAPTETLFTVREKLTNEIILTPEYIPQGELWGDYYGTLNISALDEEGTFFIEGEIDGKVYRSYEFQICNNLYDKALDYVLAFFYYQRSGCEVLPIIEGYPGHGPSHMDDASNGSVPMTERNEDSWRNLTGGWWDAGDYNKYNGLTPHALLGLIRAYETIPEFYSTPERSSRLPNSIGVSYHSDEVADILEEAIWGADYLEKCVLDDGFLIDRVGSNEIHGHYGFWGRPDLESDGDPDTHVDNRIFYGEGWSRAETASGLLQLARILEDLDLFPERVEKYRAAALRLYERYDGFGTWARTIEVNYELWLLTSNQTYLEKVINVTAAIFDDLDDPFYRYPQFGHIGVDEFFLPLSNWVLKNGSTNLLNNFTELVELRYDYFWAPFSNVGENSVDSTNFFRILKGNHSQSPLDIFYFWANGWHDGDWNVGHNSYYLSAAAASLLGFNVTGDGKFMDFALRMLDWVCGVNPFAVCMIEGLGSNNMDKYHHRASFINGNPRGAIPGAVPNGIARLDSKNYSAEADLPYYDQGDWTLLKVEASYQANEPWIPHNYNMLMVLSFLKQMT